MMLVHIKTYGCQMNERDSEIVADLLARRGFGRAGREAEAQAVIVNTCSVRGKAEDKAIGKLRLLVARSRPGRRIGAMGCLVQRLGAGIFELVPGLHFAVGTQAFSRLPDVLAEAGPDRPPILALEPDGPWMDQPFGHQPGKVSAFVNILLGCNRACSYCVVPRVRGPEWSRSAAGILEEIRNLAVSGVREVVLLGQSVMAYGRHRDVWEGLPPSPAGFREPFPRLLEAAAAVPGIRRVRFTSGHPSGCTDELARAMAGVPGVCPHLHLPLQSGADRILTLMNRGYTREHYVRAARRIQAAVPNLVLSTDIIVGFPSETEEEFLQTRRLMEDLGFDNAFIFQYSPRPGTPAADLPDDVPPADKLRRTQTLLEDQDRRSRAAGQALIGHDVEVLVEGPSRRDKTRWAGRTPWNRLVVFEADRVAAGEVALVRVERATPQTLGGKRVEG